MILPGRHRSSDALRMYCTCEWLHESARHYTKPEKNFSALIFEQSRGGCGRGRVVWLVASAKSLDFGQGLVASSQKSGGLQAGFGT